jgi:hypothetical protein
VKMYRTRNGKRIEVAGCEAFNGHKCNHLAARKYEYWQDSLNRRVFLVCDECAERLIAAGGFLASATLVDSSATGWEVRREYARIGYAKECMGRTLIPLGGAK